MELTASSLLVAGVAVLLVLYFLNVFTYWQRRGIKCARGLKPIFGHLLPVVMARKPMGDVIRAMYEDFRGHSMVGMFAMNTPQLLIREPGLVKTVMQTNFNSFHDNVLKVDPSIDPLVSKNPFFTYGEEWATGRKRLTYAFSSMRLKILFQSVLGVTKKFDIYLKRKIGGTGKFETEMKDLFSKFTGEVVANAGLGVEGFCFDDKPKSTSFQQIGQSFLEPSMQTAIVQNLVFLMPQLNKILRMPFIPKKVDRFFRDIVRDVLENRRKESVPRNDFFQLMIDLEKTEGEKLDEEVVASHALSFFVDGYETSSVTLSFVGYLLAAHQDIQNKLRDEINTVMDKYKGALTYEGLKEMTYLEQVIAESQRHYPVLGAIMKTCTQEFELKGSDGVSCKVKPGTIIVISTNGMQMDPEYWSDPEVFDPDRFSDERKKNIERFAFLPFGEGPRICVGMRMAMLQMKACLAVLVKNYSLELSPKTQLPIKLSPNHFLAAAIGGLWVNIKPL